MRRVLVYLNFVSPAGTAEVWLTLWIMRFPENGYTTEVYGSIDTLT